MSAQSLRLHRKLYTRAAIDAAIAAYTEICKVSVRHEGDYYQVDLTDIDPDVEDVVAAELANYTLAEVVERRHA
jgi:hypothetical protein